MFQFLFESKLTVIFKVMQKYFLYINKKNIEHLKYFKANQ